MKIWNLGYPRVGKKRELKKALETYWSKQMTTTDLEDVARKLCTTRWTRQHDLGVESIPVNDFSLYDHMLDMSLLLGAIPARFEKVPQTHWMDLYFAMARGIHGEKSDVVPMDMTKWFNSNYHYLVPELDANTPFKIHWDKLFFELDHAKKHDFNFHPVLVGPWTYVKLSRLTGITGAEVLKKIVPLYAEVLRELKKRDFKWVQIDEPSLCQDLLRDELRGARKIYEELSNVGPSILLTTYFESPDPWITEVANFPVAGVHFDMVRGTNNLGWLKTKSFPKDKVLSLGVVSGRNIWLSPLKEIRKEVQELCSIYSHQEVWIAPSNSLLHLPHDKNIEKKWDKEFLSWVSFADQRLEELSVLKKALSGDRSVEATLQECERVLIAKPSSPRVHRSDVKQAVERIDVSMKNRKLPFSKRIKAQCSQLNLPLLPTTTIGSFPQTSEIRKSRLDWKKGTITDADYKKFCQEEIERVVRFQEKLGLDILVHGECERNDMVEYFGELLEGFTFSEHGWVQSYGSRCVKPPIIFGDIKRKGPMTVDWFKYSQSLTSLPMKGMLTGPVTILNWSFVREDQPREKTTFQLALAIRDEVRDLERAGAKVIQIDEAALREGLPIKRAHWNQYLNWATDAFRICASVVKDETQIQTHMCYSEFGDIMDSVLRLDADVLLIENARSGSSFSECFKKHRYDNHIGPGVYDIHSPRIPTTEECQQAIRQLLELFPPDRIWINPDCGLKTRKYEEVEPALESMVNATKNVRLELLREKEAQGAKTGQATNAPYPH